MSDDNLDTTVDGEGEGIKGLRKQYEAEKKQRAELEARLAAFEQAERATRAVDVFKSKGLDEAKAAAAAKLYNGDEVSEDAVGKWLEDFSAIFPTSTGDSVPDENALNAARVSAASFGSGPDVGRGPSGPIGDPEEALRLLNSGMPYEDLEKLGLVAPRAQLWGAKR